MDTAKIQGSSNFFGNNISQTLLNGVTINSNNLAGENKIWLVSWDSIFAALRNVTTETKHMILYVDGAYRLRVSKTLLLQCAENYEAIQAELS